MIIFTNFNIVLIYKHQHIHISECVDMKSIYEHKNYFKIIEGILVELIDKFQLKNELHRLHADICSALGDPNRILILYCLAEKTKSVSELVDILEIPQPSVSRHLKILKERNMVIPHRAGKNIIYELIDFRVIEALDLLRGMMQDSLSNQAILAQAAKESNRNSEVEDK
ncbi:MAG: winged helix-turn-helix transcriptional regulator [Anaerolineaceae bacterium]|nr:winged helix-turn-helix transcriptional regulator [Anaerolineaceae bacterium]